MSNYNTQGPPPPQSGAPYPPPQQQPQGVYLASNQAGYTVPPAQGQAYHQGQGQQGYAPVAAGQPPAAGYAPQGQGYPPPQGQGNPSGPPPPGILPKYTGEVPDTNRMDDPNLQDPNLAPAPPSDMPQMLPGYGNMGYNEAPTAPPPSYGDISSEPPARDAIPEFVNLTSDEAKRSLTEFVDEQCCYGKGPVNNMNITEIKPSHGFQYMLESFCESRNANWTSTAYRGETIVTSGNPPGPWEIPLQQPELFKNHQIQLEVPNTAIVKPCHVCGAQGFNRCFRCYGRGEVGCQNCHGTGTRWLGQESRRCTFCQGYGSRRCDTCGGCGQTQCFPCQGYRNLKWYIQLTVKWTNHTEEHLVERTALPPEFIKRVEGKIALQETGPRVFPINHFPDQEINQASNGIVSKHANQYTTERMLQQRHTLRVVPVNSVHYRLSDKNGSFIVYGLENRTYFPDYPATCCWGCNIL